MRTTPFPNAPTKAQPTPLSFIFSVTSPRPMVPQTADYRLSCELRGHEDDVHGICISGNSGFATSSRDKTVRFWAPNPDKKHWYVLSKTLAGHSSFVGLLAWIPPGDRFPEGGIVFGGMDTQVLLWDLSKGELVEMMKGHQFQVIGLAVDDNWGYYLVIHCNNFQVLL